MQMQPFSQVEPLLGKHSHCSSFQPLRWLQPSSGLSSLALGPLHATLPSHAGVLWPLPWSYLHLILTVIASPLLLLHHGPGLPAASCSSPYRASRNPGAGALGLAPRGTLSQPVFLPCTRMFDFSFLFEEKKHWYDQPVDGSQYSFRIKAPSLCWALT